MDQWLLARPAMNDAISSGCADRDICSVRLGHPGAERISPDTFFGLRFTLSAATDSDPSVVSVPLPALDRDPLWELCTGSKTIRRETADGIGLVATADHIVVHTRVPLAPHGLAAATSATYRKLLHRTRTMGYPQLVRIWNFIPDIHHGCGEEDNYLRFNRGRALVFDEFAMPATRYPAATVVGSPAGTPLTVIVLASRIEPLAVENPRQTSAWRYPRQYGPHPPAFARAMLLPHRAGATLFISGTASIVGHESRHSRIGPQLREALANIETLKAAARERLPGCPAPSRGSWLVYLRDAADRDAIAPEVRQWLGDGDAVAFLQADICRRELLVEIEGACELTG
jgi:chorismate lyase/3-hydroxybenzoate synthase